MLGLIKLRVIMLRGALLRVICYTVTYAYAGTRLDKNENIFEAKHTSLVLQGENCVSKADLIPSAQNEFH